MGTKLFSENSSNYSWKHNFRRVEFQNQYGNEYFFSKILYFKKHNSHLVETLCVWLEHIPYILPKVDIVLVHKKILSFLEQEGLIRYSEFIKQLGRYFAQEENYLVLHLNEAEEISKTFNRLRFF